MYVSFVIWYVSFVYVLCDTFELLIFVAQIFILTFATDITCILYHESSADVSHFTCRLHYTFVYFVLVASMCAKIIYLGRFTALYYILIRMFSLKKNNNNETQGFYRLTIFSFFF